MDRVLSATYALVKRYVSRQHIVYDALKELRPDFFELHRMKDFSHEELLEYFEFVKECVSRTPFRGTWGSENEWDYFIHGGGCRLTHRITGEPVDWDAPDPLGFDVWKFSFWLEWAFQNPIDDDASVVKAAFEAQGQMDTLRLVEFVRVLIDRLYNLGYLDVEQGSKGIGYRLVERQISP